MNSRQDIDGEETADADACSGKRSELITQEIGTLLREEMGSNAHGQATLIYQSQTRDDKENLFGKES